MKYYLQLKKFYPQSSVKICAIRGKIHLPQIYTDFYLEIKILSANKFTI